MNKPLRNSAQSVDEQIHALVHDFVTGPVVVAFLFLLFTGFEWLRYYRPYGPAPVVYSLVAIIVVLYATIRLFLLWSRVRALKLARDGERAVGQFLEGLRERGYRIFNDVIGKGFSLDHVLIGPAGVFTVEAEVRSRPIRGRARVIFDGARIRVNGGEPDRAPIAQAKRRANRLRELLAQTTGHDFDVRPVIIYPGWSVEWAGPKNRSIWVLNPKWLKAFLEHEPLRLSSDDIHLVSFHLSRFERAG
ncbi:MAG: nuclease-related domain-containing protein [Alphaproteobacteria bacterium]